MRQQYNVLPKIPLSSCDLAIKIQYGLHCRKYYTLYATWAPIKRYIFEFLSTQISVDESSRKFFEIWEYFIDFYDDKPTEFTHHKHSAYLFDILTVQRWKGEKTYHLPILIRVASPQECWEKNVRKLT